VQLVATCWGHAARVWDADLAGPLLATAGEDGTCRLWDVADGSCVAVIKVRKKWKEAPVASLQISWCLGGGSMYLCSLCCSMGEDWWLLGFMQVHGGLVSWAAHPSSLYAALQHCICSAPSCLCHGTSQQGEQHAPG
jgi:hypothetical protein